MFFKRHVNVQIWGGNENIETEKTVQNFRALKTSIFFLREIKHLILLESLLCLKST